MLSEEGLASFNKDNSANFSGKWKWNEAFQGIYLTRMCKKFLVNILISVVVLVLKSKGLYLWH